MIHNFKGRVSGLRRIPGCQSPNQLQPIRTLRNSPREKPKEWLSCLAHKLKHTSSRTQDWWTPNKSGALSFIPRGMSCSRMRNTTLIWTLESASKHRAFHKATQYNTVQHKATQYNLVIMIYTMSHAAFQAAWWQNPSYFKESCHTKACVSK